MSNQDTHFYEFDSFRIDARKRLLLRDGEVAPLTPKAFDTLLALIANRGRVMEKDELMRAVWPDTIVEESALSRNIYLLRKALGESPDEHRYIVTAPGRGYRFVADVKESLDEPAEVVVATKTRASIVTEEEWESGGGGDGATGGQGEWGSEAAELSFSHSPRRPIAPSPRLLLLPTLLAGAAMLLILSFAYWEMTRRGRQAEAGLAVKSIAVLPFKPLVAESKDEYLQMGIADVLITRLSNLKQLIVRPTSAVRKYAGLEQDAVSAGRELKVDAVLDGNIQRVGDRVRVTARLIAVGDGAPLWAETFDEKFTDIFRVQDALSAKLAGALALKLSGEERRRLARRDTANPEAFQSYIKGRFFWSKWNGEGLKKAIECFEQALANDPDYALAYSGLADSYNLLGYLNVAPPHEAFPKSEAAAKRALALDGELGEGRLSLAKTKLFYNWDWPGFERELKRALDLNPNYADAHGMNGTYLTAMGRFDEAIAARKRALDLDPASPLYTVMVGWPHFYARRYDEAITWYRKALELDPNFSQAHTDIGLCYFQQGKYDEGVAETLKARSLSGAPPETVEALRQAYAVAGKTGYWRKELELARRSKTSPWRMARIHAELGDKDQAFAWLNKAYEERVSLMTFLKVTPIFDGLRDDARFAELLRRIGLAK